MMENNPQLTTKTGHYPATLAKVHNLRQGQAVVSSAFLFAPVVVLGLTLLGFTLRLYQLGLRSLWYDELLELDIAHGPLFEIAPQLIRHAAMPLDYYLLHGWVMFGRQEGWVRFPALFFGTLSIPLIYALARRLFNRRVGLLAAALLTISSFAIRYSQEARPYALLLVCVLAAMLGLWQTYQTQQYRYWALTIAGLIGASLSHYFAIFILLPIGLFVLVQQFYHIKQKQYWLHTAFFVFTIFALLLLFIYYGRVGQLYSVGERFLREINQPELYTLPPAEKPNRGQGPPLAADFFVTKIVAPLSTAHPLLMLWYGVFFLAGVLALIGYRYKNRATILLLLGWLFLPILLTYAFLLHRGTFYAVRYILYTLPAYLLLVAYGLDRVVSFFAKQTAKLNPNQQPVWFTRTWSITLSLLFLGPLVLAQTQTLQDYYPSQPYEDWRSVGQLLQHNATSADAVIAVKAEPTMNWYYPPGQAEFGKYSRSAAIWQTLHQQPRRWFVLSSYSFKIDRGLRTWLAEQGAVRIVIDRRVVVYYHQEGKTRKEMLEQVQHFSLPQKAETYAVLANQFEQVGDVETSKAFYQMAVELAATPTQKAGYKTRLAALPPLR